MTPPNDHPTCGTCRHLVLNYGETKGSCYLLPPQVMPGGFQKRPELRSAERGCSHHTPLEQGQVPEVKWKRNPETPGQAAKAARR